MKLGVWTPLPHVIRPEPEMEVAIAELSSRSAPVTIDRSFRFAANFLRRAEDLGFDITLVAERFLGPDLESWVLASALAASTRRIELMVAVHPGIINPQVAAKMGATLDRISGGRAAVNVVNGWWEQEFNIFGNGSWLAASEKRYQRMDEFMHVLRGMWSNDSLTAKGEFFPVENAQLPIKAFRQPSVPVYAASQAPAGKESIARFADCWFIQQTSRFNEFDLALKQVQQSVAEMKELSGKYGRQVGVGLTSHVICTKTEEEAQSIALELERYGKSGTVSFIAATGLASGLVGTPQMIAERLTAYHEAGVSLAMLHFHPMFAGFENFAVEVLPQLAWRQASDPAADRAAGADPRGATVDG